MKKQYLTTLFLSLLSCASAFSQQILSVTSADQAPYDDMTKLIRDHFTGSGIEILAVEANNDPRAIGYFTDGDSIIGLKRGLVMSSGFAKHASNDGIFFADNSIVGDTNLEQLEAIATNVVNDVSYFRITFRPFNDRIRFRYVFASEEYPEFACTAYNDVFGFFLSGPNPDSSDYIDQNIALVPGTKFPVAINNLHPENLSAPPCPAFNEQFYHDNNLSNNQPVYDGFTDVFMAEAAVVPCATYVMLIAIADVGDSALDSGVFLEAKSLESDVQILSSLDVEEAIIPEVAIADTISFSFSDVPAHLLPLQIKILGTATNGIDFQAVDSITWVNTPGEIVYFVIQPIQDSLQEQSETVIFNVCGTAANECFSKTFTLYIADPDSLYSPSEEVFLQAGGSTLLSLSPTSVSNKTWSFSNTSPRAIAPLLFLVESKISVDVPLDFLNDLSILQSVCININHPWDDDLDLFLVAPNETFVELSTDNGANGDNYSNTCFSPSATQDIRGGFPFAPATAAPFTGMFQPEGLWSDIQGTSISGTWSLGVLDDQNLETGTLLDWAITFSTYDLGNFKYHWNTGDTTSSMLVSNPGIYSVTISNQVGSFSKSFVVKEGSVGAQTPDLSNQIFRLFPNPSTGETVLVLDKIVAITSLKIYDSNGVLLLKQDFAGPIQGASNLPPGVYFVALECSEGIFVEKLMRW